MECLLCHWLSFLLFRTCLSDPHVLCIFSSHTSLDHPPSALNSHTHISAPSRLMVFKSLHLADPHLFIPQGLCFSDLRPPPLTPPHHIHTPLGQQLPAHPGPSPGPASALRPTSLTSLTWLRLPSQIRTPPLDLPPLSDPHPSPDLPPLSVPHLSPASASTVRPTPLPWPTLSPGDISRRPSASPARKGWAQAAGRRTPGGAP